MSEAENLRGLVLSLQDMLIRSIIRVEALRLLLEEGGVSHERFEQKLAEVQALFASTLNANRSIPSDPHAQIQALQRLYERP